MNWYDLIAPICDRIIEKTYAPYRKAVVQSLNLESGSTVLDLGCCSGLSFESIIDVIGAEGIVIGVGLERARIKAR